MQSHLIGGEGTALSLLEKLADSLFEHLLFFYTGGSLAHHCARREPRLTSGRLQLIECYMEDNLRQAVTVTDIANLIGVSEGTCSVSFAWPKA